MKAQPLNLEPGETCTMVLKNLWLPRNNAAQALEHLKENYGEKIAIPEGIKETEQGQFVPRIEVQIQAKGRFSWSAQQIEGYLVLACGVADGEVLIERDPA